mmetsp:Transcript_35481/g.60306  ORF Transcript_35481/g.60306 Transcript_35481/m.60306 type:complete len:230 (+) Transcript_35481:392-1081(+)
MILQCFVGSTSKVKIEPNQATIETPDNDMITRGVHVQRGDVTTSRQQPLHHCLLHQMIHPDVLLGRHEQERLVRMKACQLGLPALGLSKGLLRRRLGKLVDQHGGGSRLGRDGDEVISLAMPFDAGYVRAVGAKEGDGSGLSSVGADGSRCLRRSRRGGFLSEGGPGDGFCRTRFGRHVPAVLTRGCRGEEGIGDFGIIQSTRSCGDYNGTLSNGGKEDVVRSVGVPFE